MIFHDVFHDLSLFRHGFARGLGRGIEELDRGHLGYERDMDIVDLLQWFCGILQWFNGIYSDFVGY